MKVKIVRGLIYTLLVFLVAGFALLYFSPDYNLYVVRSGSMTPAIRVGDVIITGPVDGPINGEVTPGTVITYQHTKGTITHRVYSRDGAELVTKGDAVEDIDPWSVSMSDVRGVYLFKIPYMGFVTSFIQTKTGWFITIIIPAALLVLWLAKDIVKEAFSET